MGGKIAVRRLVLADILADFPRKHEVRQLNYRNNVERSLFRFSIITLPRKSDEVTILEIKERWPTGFNFALRKHL